jgi:hypothetical protein
MLINQLGFTKAIGQSCGALQILTLVPDLQGLALVVTLHQREQLGPW